MSRRRSEKRKAEQLDGLDLHFNTEWNFIKKRVIHHDLDLSQFDELWGALIYANNDWRTIRDDPEFIFSRTQGLRYDNMDKFHENIDYFVGKENLLNFIKKQVKYRNDHDFLPLFERDVNRVAIINDLKSKSSNLTSPNVHNSVKTESILHANHSVQEESESPSRNLLAEKKIVVQKESFDEEVMDISRSMKKRIRVLPPETALVHAVLSSSSHSTSSRPEPKKAVTAVEQPSTNQSKSSSKTDGLGSYANRDPSTFNVGDEVDVEDNVDHIICPAIIIAVHRKHVRIHYIGWDTVYDTDISNMSRLFPPYSFVKRVKVWCGLCEKIPYWPCVAYIRPALRNSPEGVSYLKRERCVFVIPALPHLPELAEWAKGRWIDTYSFQAFSRSFTRKRPLSPALERYLSRAMTELENDPLSSFVPNLRFIGSYEYYTSLSLWNVKKESVSAAATGTASATTSSSGKSSAISSTDKQRQAEPQPSKNQKLVYKSSRYRRCAIVFNHSPTEPSDSYLALCASAIALQQVGYDDTAMGKSSRIRLQDQVLKNIQSYVDDNDQDDPEILVDAPTSCTYLIGDVGCRLQFQGKWNLMNTSS